jgi:hypothetical protein
MLEVRLVDAFVLTALKNLKKQITPTRCAAMGFPADLATIKKSGADETI